MADRWGRVGLGLGGVVSLDRLLNELLDAYREHTQMLLQEVHDRGEMIKRLVNERDEARQKMQERRE